MAIVLFSCGEEVSGVVVGGKVLMEVCLMSYLIYHEKVIIFLLKYEEIPWSFEQNSDTIGHIGW